MDSKHCLRRAATAFVFALALGLPASALALDVDTAKQRGLVGEQTDGFLGIVTSEPTSELRQLVAEVNTRRRAHYEEIARRNQTPVEAVAALAGQRLIERTPAGQYVGHPSTGWYVKR